MKWHIPSHILLSLGLCHCGLGTEVGNGVRHDPTPVTSTATGTTESGTTTDAAGPDESKVSTPNSTTAPTSSLSPYLLVACASPFAESVQGNFANSKGHTDFTVVLVSAQQKKVTWLDSMQIYTVQSASTSASPYAIETLSASPQLSCGSITTQTLANGSTERSLTLSDETKLSWTLQAGTVTSMRVLAKGSTEEIWLKTTTTP